MNTGAEAFARIVLEQTRPDSYRSAVQEAIIHVVRETTLSVKHEQRVQQSVDADTDL
jgi:hypothetical protein